MLTKNPAAAILARQKPQVLASLNKIFQFYFQLFRVLSLLPVFIVIFCCIFFDSSTVCLVSRIKVLAYSSIAHSAKVPTYL